MNVDDAIARLEELERDHRKALAVIDEVKTAIAAGLESGDVERRTCPRCGIRLLKNVSIEEHLANVHDVAA